MSNTEGPQFDSAGWGVFLTLWVLITGPCVYLIWARAYNDTGWFVTIGMGFLGAGVIAGTLTWIANSILQARAARIIEKQRQQERKQKKKKKKSK